VGPAEASDLRGRAAAGLVYFIGLSVRIVAVAAMVNEPSVRLHDHRAAFKTAAQVLVGMLVALAIETALFRRGDLSRPRVRRPAEGRSTRQAHDGSRFETVVRQIVRDVCRLYRSRAVLTTLRSERRDAERGTQGGLHRLVDRP
jgi:hypothetical protein